jgi:hypothetical protein
MAGLVPAIHAFAYSLFEDVDARDKPGHDECAHSFRSVAGGRYSLVKMSSALGRALKS